MVELLAFTPKALSALHDDTFAVLGDGLGLFGHVELGLGGLDIGQFSCRGRVRGNEERAAILVGQ